MIKDRFESKLTKTADGCWQWANRHCQFWSDGHPESAHRVAYRLYCGPIPRGALVLRSCKNPRCVAPHHLYLGTHANVDGPGRAKLTDAQVSEVLALHAGGASTRSISRHFGVVEGPIRRIISGEAYKFVPRPGEQP